MHAGAQVYVDICANVCECTFSSWIQTPSPSCFLHMDSRCRISLSPDHRTGYNHTTPVGRILPDKPRNTRYIGKVCVKQIALDSKVSLSSIYNPRTLFRVLRCRASYSMEAFKDNIHSQLPPTTLYACEKSIICSLKFSFLTFSLIINQRL